MRQKSKHFQYLSLIKEFSIRLFFGLLIMGITVVIQLLYPKVISYFIDNVQLSQTSDWYNGIALLMILAVCIQACATALRYYLFESTGLMIVTKIRRLLHQALISQNIAFFDKHNIGELTNRLAVDVEVLQDTLTMGLAISLRALCVLVGGIAMLLWISPVLSVMLLVFVPLSLFLAKWVGDKLRMRSRDIQDCQAQTAKVAHENLTNIKLVHAFNGQNKAQEIYVTETQTTFNVSLSCTRFIATFQGLSSLTAYLALLITLWFGANLISKGSLSIGELTSFVIYAAMVTSSAAAVSDFWSDWMRTMGATERIFEIISTDKFEQTKYENNLCIQGNILFKNVDFKYPQRPEQFALKNFNLSISSGEKIALIGRSGAGKSTVASLILGFYQTNHGSIYIDGTALNELNINAVRKNIAIVEQEPSLFCGTIFDNIVYGSEHQQAETAEVIYAAKQANADEFITAFPDGYNTVVGERGVQLSGGQKQRIAIARALLRNPKILILDEATSALDSSSEANVQKALDVLMTGRTTIMIAHRFSTIAKADRILVLDQGQIIEQGDHQTLKAQQAGLYAKLMKNQLAEV